MILTIPAGGQQVWGSAVWLNVTEATNPEGLAGFGVVFWVKNADGVQLVHKGIAPVGGNVSLNISPWLTAPGVISIEWGYMWEETYAWGSATSYHFFEEDVRSITLVNETVVTAGDVTIPGGVVQLTGNPIEIRVTANSLSAEKDNYRVAMRITCAALIGSPYVEPIAPGSNLESIFEISGFVDQPMAFDFNYPAVGAFSFYDARVFNLILDTGEVYLDDEGKRVEAWNGDLAGFEMRVIKGALRPYELGLLNDTGKTFYSEYIQGGKFLTRLPNFQKVAPSHIPRLWYLSRWTDDHVCTAHLKINTADKVAHVPITENFVLPVNGLMDFAFNPAFWGAYYPDVESYEFWLSDAAGDISEHRTYLVDRGYYERSFTFYCFNPLGGLDLLWLTGQYKEGVKTEAEMAYRPIPYGSGSKVGSLSTISASSQRTWEINTGSKTRDELLAMRDFLEAKLRWMVDPDNDARLIPVVIESGDFLFFDSMEDIQNFEIRILEAHL